MLVGARQHHGAARLAGDPPGQLTLREAQLDHLQIGVEIELEIGDSKLMLSDPFPQSSVRPPT